MSGGEWAASGARLRRGGQDWVGGCPWTKSVVKCYISIKRVPLDQVPLACRGCRWTPVPTRYRNTSCWTRCCWTGCRLTGHQPVKRHPVGPVKGAEAGAVKRAPASQEAVPAPIKGGPQSHPSQGDSSGVRAGAADDGPGAPSCDGLSRTGGTMDSPLPCVMDWAFSCPWSPRWSPQVRVCAVGGSEAGEEEARGPAGGGGDEAQGR